MYENIGGKIKSVAQALCLLGIILSVIIGLFFLVQGGINILIGLSIIVIGAILSWLSSFLSYGIGQLIENSDILVDKVDTIEAQVQPRNPEERLIMLRDWRERNLISEEEFLYLIKESTLQ